MRNPVVPWGCMGSSAQDEPSSCALIGLEDIRSGTIELFAPLSRNPHRRETPAWLSTEERKRDGIIAA